ncbi:MAG TPA: DnaD domain protein [Bacillota bacterium]|nr:DnaD domain protein [Bacillota bacterium]
MTFIGKILPVEGYRVELAGHLPVDYTISLTHLYQPLIGIDAIMLYQTLLNDIELANGAEPQTHHTLMNYMNKPLDEIYQARLKLEGIGLLATYERKTTDHTVYTYRLQSPFAPGDFFQDAMLSELLYHHIGAVKYRWLKERLTKPDTTPEGENVTASFHHVFDTFQPAMEQANGEEVPAEGPQPILETLDFSWLEQMLKQRMIPVKKVLTPQNKTLITQMMHVYDLAAHEVEKCVLWALTEDHTLHKEEFKEACHDLFKAKYPNQPIRLVKKQPQRIKSAAGKKPATKEEQLIQHLETISPKQLLEDLSSGGQASSQDMRIIREVMTSQGLPAPVMNVLIHYVLLQSNMKLSKNYMEKIASHWSRARLKTAREAMEFAKREQKVRQAKQTSHRKTYSNEVIPDWFKEREQKQKESAKRKKHVKHDNDKEKEKAEIEALLKRFTSHNNQ